MKQKRFKSKIGQEYNLVILTIPYFEKFQAKIGQTIKNYFKNSPLKEIKILEIGCGPGNTTEIVLNADKRIKAVTIDNEPIMLKQAKKNLARYLTEKRVKVIKDDALNFISGLPDNSFTVFASGLTIHNFNKNYREKLLQEIYRILKPKGLFINADRYAFDDQKKFQQVLNWQIRQYKKVFSNLNKPDLLKEWMAHEEDDKKPEIIMKEKVAINQMKKIGFKNIKIIFRQKIHAVLVAFK